MQSLGPTRAATEEANGHQSSFASVCRCYSHLAVTSSFFFLSSPASVQTPATCNLLALQVNLWKRNYSEQSTKSSVLPNTSWRRTSIWRHLRSLLSSQTLLQLKRHMVSIQWQVSIVLRSCDISYRPSLTKSSREHTRARRKQTHKQNHATIWHPPASRLDRWHSPMSRPDIS